MEPDQLNLVFTAICLFISVAGAIVSALSLAFFDP